VLVSHSFTVVTGKAAEEPLRVALGLTPGSIAVDVFFIVSGLLVTTSIIRSRSWLDFVVARTLRILPGLFAAVALTALLIGGYFYVGPGTFLRGSDVLAYIARDALPFAAPVESISDVFDGNPAGDAFNISLWTLPIEVSMYRWVLLAWLFAALPRLARWRGFRWLILAAFAYSAWRHLGAVGMPLEMSPARLPFMFFAGALVAVFPLRVRLAPALLPILLIAVLASALHNRAFFVTYSLALWYLVIGMAYLRAPALRHYNRVGDYSFGMYLYAWPIQQAVIASVPSLNVAQHIAVSAVLTAACAVASWHLIERRALAQKRRVVDTALQLAGAPAVR